MDIDFIFYVMTIGLIAVFLWKGAFNHWQAWCNVIIVLNQGVGLT